jgi:hypothetical protein
MLRKGKNLKTFYPSLASEWHPTKNGDLTPKDLSTGSNKKVWWKCPKGDDHEWEANINNRTNRNSSCPVCANQKIVHSNCLATLNPDLAKEWHPTKNGKHTPNDVGAGSHKKVWWKCPKGEDHEWEAQVVNRNKGAGCLICSGQKVVKSNSLGILNSKLSIEWHPTKNGKLTPFDVSVGSNKKIWWKCPKGEDHEWKTAIKERSRGGGCPICVGRIVTKSNSLAIMYPELAKEWHPTKNGDLTPKDLSTGSNKKVWWKCPKGDDHEWEANINNRVRKGTSCGVCANVIIVKSNCLEALYPKLSKEWHPTKNGSLTPDKVAPVSPLKVWWKCPRGDDHEWQNQIRKRVSGQGCPFCTLTPQSRQELSITFELKQFFTINPKGFKTKINEKVWSIDIFISELNLGIEFDGSHWHKDSIELDKLKTRKLSDLGFRIMRVREEPLKQITEIDILSKKPFNAKNVANDILRFIIKNYQLNDTRVEHINDYIRKNKVQNEFKLDEYIEKILEEKSTRKKSK